MSVQEAMTTIMALQKPSNLGMQLNQQVISIQ
jgi:hypothetical protein